MPPPPFSRCSARLVRRHRPLTSVFALGLRSEIEFLGRFFSSVDQLLPTLPMQAGHDGDGADAGGLRRKVGVEADPPMHAQGMRRSCLLSRPGSCGDRFSLVACHDLAARSKPSRSSLQGPQARKWAAIPG